MIPYSQRKGEHTRAAERRIANQRPKGRKRQRKPNGCTHSVPTDRNAGTLVSGRTFTIELPTAGSATGTSGHAKRHEYGVGGQGRNVETLHRGTASAYVRRANSLQVTVRRIALRRCAPCVAYRLKSITQRTKNQSCKGDKNHDYQQRLQGTHQHYAERG